MNNSKNDQCVHESGNSKCSHKGIGCYGGYCKKHKDCFLLKDGIIQIDSFTGDPKDYKLCDLKKYCNTHISKCPSKFKKQDYFDKFCNHVNQQRNLMKNINSIYKIQSNTRRWLLNKNIKLRGLPYVNRKLCNNDEDFYTYEPVQDIEDLYFFSYKDHQNNHWGFDVRSLKKLLEMNYGNPYTTEAIPEECKVKVNQLIQSLEGGNITTVIDTGIVADRKAVVKQKFVDIFAQMEYIGHSCDVKWVLDLNNQRLKRLYKELEDIWNYRANLDQQTKQLIVPPDGRLCVMPVHDYSQCHNKIELQEILANALTKIGNSSDQSSMSLGYMYFIIALSYVSRPCFMTNTWVQSVF